MVVQFVCRLAVTTALTLAVASTAHADYTITVKIGDTTLPAVTNGPVIIPAGTYSHAATGGSVTIANAGGTAQVEFPSLKSDGAVDSIKLVNAKITATRGTVNNFPISFQGDMQPNPVTPTTIYYKMKAVGLFQQASGSSILVGMYLKNPSSEGFTFLNQQQYTPGSVTFTIFPPGTGWPPANHSQLSGTRTLRIDIALKLTDTKFVDFNTTNNSRAIEMYSSGVPDKGKTCDPADTTCQEDDVPGLYLPSLLEWSDDLGRQNWFCRTIGLFCSDWP